MVYYRLLLFAFRSTVPSCEYAFSDHDYALSYALVNSREYPYYIIERVESEEDDEYKKS